MEFNIQTVRTITTGLFHPETPDCGLAPVMRMIEHIVGEDGILTHHLAVAGGLIREFLREEGNLSDRFWDGSFDPSHAGMATIPAMDANQQEAFWNAFREGLKNFWSR